MSEVSKWLIRACGTVQSACRVSGNPIFVVVREICTAEPCCPLYLGPAGRVGSGPRLCVVVMLVIFFLDPPPPFPGGFAVRRSGSFSYFSGSGGIGIGMDTVLYVQFLCEYGSILRDMAITASFSSLGAHCKYMYMPLNKLYTGRAGDDQVRRVCVAA